jgi:hypothetical protein
MAPPGSLLLSIDVAHEYLFMKSETEELPAECSSKLIAVLGSFQSGVLRGCWSGILRGFRSGVLGSFRLRTPAWVHILPKGLTSMGY